MIFFIEELKEWLTIIFIVMVVGVTLLTIAYVSYILVPVLILCIAGAIAYIAVKGR